ncbi:MAG: hypothetical protein E7678_06435 [Ruminococcaceae bacterium]|nr:hypothetical protein [Oscillospiraceae bacterium]
MIALIIIICIVAIIALLLSVKITLKIRYTDKLRVFLKVFFVKIQLYPKKDKKKRYPHSMSKKKAQKIKNSLKKKPKKLKKKKKKIDEEEEEAEEREEKTDLISIVSIIFSFVRNFVALFAKAIRVKASRLKITVATDEAAKTALTYTAITQSINVLFPMLDELKTVKKLPHKKELSVNIDYLSDTPTLDIDVELYIRIGGILKAVCGAAIKAFKKAVKNEIKKLEKQR